MWRRRGGWRRAERGGGTEHREDGRRAGGRLWRRRGEERRAGRGAEREQRDRRDERAPELQLRRLHGGQLGRAPPGERGGDGVSVWILKPSDGGKGANIKVMDTLANIEAHFDALEDGSIAWVASEYIKKPLLLQPGSRKFDVRIWALLDANYDVHVWNNGVLRTCSVPFTLDAASLNDPFVHLSNHCIRRIGPDGVMEARTSVGGVQRVTDASAGRPTLPLSERDSCAQSAEAAASQSSSRPGSMMSASL